MATAAQQALIDRIADVLGGDTRIEAAWLAGSFARGEADDFSDVDVLVLVADGAYEDVKADYARDLGDIADTALINPLFGGAVVNVVTTDWDRFDLSLVTAEHLHRYAGVALEPLFNRTGHAPPEAPERPAYAPSSEAITAMATEFLRVLGLLVVVAGREDWVNAFFGIGHMRRATVDLMLEENRIAPQDRGGALHLNKLLTSEQHAELAALPPLVWWIRSSHDDGGALGCELLIRKPH